MSRDFRHVLFGQTTLSGPLLKRITISQKFSILLFQFFSFDFRYSRICLSVQSQCNIKDPFFSALAQINIFCYTLALLKSKTVGAKNVCSNLIEARLHIKVAMPTSDNYAENLFYGIKSLVVVWRMVGQFACSLTSSFFTLIAANHIWGGGGSNHVG